MTRSKTEISVNTPTGAVDIKDHTLLVMQGANRKNLRHLNKTLLKANPAWTGAVITLNPGESLHDLDIDQSLQVCFMLMAKHFPNVYADVRAQLEEMQKPENIEKLVEEGDSSGQEPTEGNP